MKNGTKIEGFYYDVWQVLENRLNFTTSVTKSSVSSGIWSSMMKSVKAQEYDLVLTGNSQTARRAKTLDFSFAITPSTLRMFYLRDSESLNLSLYINSFHSQSWLAIISSIFTLFILVTSLIFLANHLGITTQKYDFGIRTLSAFLYLSHLGRRFPKEPQEVSLRTAFFSISFCGFMIITLYRSMISASLAVKIYKPPVNSIEDILQSPFNLIIANGTSVHEMFKNAPVNSTYKQLLDSGKLVLSKSDPSGLQTIITESSSDLVLGVYQPLKIRPEYPCLIASVPKDYRRIGNGYIFQKDWAYTNLINFHLFKMYEEGIINSLSKKWIRENSEASCDALVSLIRLITFEKDRKGKNHRFFFSPFFRPEVPEERAW